MGNISTIRIIKTTTFVILGILLGSAAVTARAGTIEEADQLVQTPTPDKVNQALNIYQEFLPKAGSGRFCLLVRMARGAYIMGELAEKGKQEYHYEKGKLYAQRLIEERPESVEGHYWLALNLTGLAEVNWSQGLVLLPQIMKELERAQALDPTYDQAGPHRVLGRIYAEAPSWPLSVGDLYKSLHHLKMATEMAPENTTNHLFLAETLLRLGFPAQAKVELEKVFKSDQHAICAKMITEDRQRAQVILKNSNAE
ncbi:MAG: tetratricopeptide repeat protein [Desulfobacteraceae bacterium]